MKATEVKWRCPKCRHMNGTVVELTMAPSCAACGKPFFWEDVIPLEARAVEVEPL